MKLSRLVRRSFSGKPSLFLTDFTELKGWGCKIGKPELLSYLSAFPNTKNQVFSTSPDCFISPVPHTSIYQASSVDFFYPLVEDPYLQGQITVCNVLSDLYSIGAVEIDHFLAILALSTKLTEAQRKEVALGIMGGMEDKIKEAGSRIVGGQTVRNPWVITGGSAIAYIKDPNQILRNTQAQAGDLLILTKPLGTQLLVNFAQYYRISPEKKEKLIQAGLTEIDLAKITDRVHKAMSTLNLYGAMEMRNLGSGFRACTDVTGFGLRGHAENLVEIQERPVDFVIDYLPVFQGLAKYDNIVREFKLREGLAAETSGGLLIVAEESKALKFVDNMKRNHNIDSWIVGKVTEGSRKVMIPKDVQIREV